MTRTALQHHRAVVGRIRSLYDIAQLAYLLDGLCNSQYGAKIEAELEGDGSQVPAMIAKAMQDVGAALVTMTQEEVAEAIAAAGPAAGDRAGPSPLARGNFTGWLDRARRVGGAR